MHALLQKICSQEGITYEEEALNMIIHRSRGSLRDSLTMLEKCIFEKSVQTTNVEAALHLVNHAFLRKTFEAIKNGKNVDIQEIIDTLETESADVRQFSAQMTEWIVDNIGEAFEDKIFPIYRDIFDLFTNIFIQCKQVAVPMDILRMALYERIRDSVIPAKKTSPVESPKNTTIPPQNERKEDEQVADLPAPTHELPAAEKVLPKATHEITATIKETEETVENISTEFSAENFLKKIQELGVKTTLLPLLRTATITPHENTIIITTTGFGKTRCEEANTHPILAQAAQFF